MSARRAVIRRDGPGASEWRALSPPAASTQRADEDLQRERPAQQSRPIQSRRALLRRLYRRSQGRGGGSIGATRFQKASGTSSRTILLKLQMALAADHSGPHFR